MTYHTHPDYLSFLAGIRSQPDDDLRRLVLCDWLEEHGTEEATARAAWLRAEIDRHAGNAGKEVWGGVKPAGSAPFDLPYHLPGVLHYHTRRGFVTLVCCPFAAFLAHAPRLLPESVGLTVRLTDRPVVEASEEVGFRTAEIGYRLAGVRLREVLLLDYRDPFTDERLTGMLRRQWPDVAAWELPPELPPVVTFEWTANADGRVAPGSLLVIPPDSRLIFAPQHGDRPPERQRWEAELRARGVDPYRPQHGDPPPAGG